MENQYICERIPDRVLWEIEAVVKVLVTGGAGFIGSHTADLLVKRRHEVVVIDNLDSQVHGEAAIVPNYLNDQIVFIRGDVRDRNVLLRALEGVEAVIHLAATVGIGQSMYQIERYIGSNTYGTSTLLDVLVNEEHSVKKLVVASSMSIYGEGKYRCEKCRRDLFPGLRNEEQLKHQHWDHICPRCGSTLIPLPTDESKPLTPTSIYAISKRHQEEMCLLIGRTYGIPTVALRYFNVYGPRQTLSNPYTGCVAIFLSRLLNKKPPIIFEDGEQMRDFIHVADVAKTNVLALESGRCTYEALNVGTGSPLSIRKVVESLSEILGLRLDPMMTGRYRVGDIRCCYPDISRIRQIGFTWNMSFNEGLRDTLKWAIDRIPVDLGEKAVKELESHGLIR